MYRINPDCQICSSSSPLCLLSQHSQTLASGMLSHREEEEAGEHPPVCCYTAGCNDIISQAGDAPRSPPEPPIVQGNPSDSGLAGRGLAVCSSQQPAVHDADQGNVSRHFTGGGCCWEGPGIETQACACVYGRRDPAGGGPCWPGSPYIYYGVRRNLVVEVVEEVAVEDTVEVITEDIYATDDLLDPELQQDYQLYPT